MAFPTIRNYESGERNTNGLSIVVTRPLSYEGDLLIVGISLDGSRTISAPDANWTLLANPTNTTANRFAIFYKVFGGSESSSYTFTWVTTSERGTWFSIAITEGTWSGTPEIATAYANSTSCNAPSLSPSWGSGDTLWLALHGWDYSRTSTSSISDYTLLTYIAPASIYGAGHRTFYRQVAASSQDPAAITISATDTNYAHTVAIREYVASGPNMGCNIGGTWKTATEVHVNIGGTWKQATNVYTNIGGVWKEST